ncbi:MAG TPA: SDR family NAD(P)-dependent oxidoreductase [Gaiellaceae bacterium]|nr:SDR family NAD(P)-dependent oxidoreductase [Gaiellaceae bacterium]
MTQRVAVVTGASSGIGAEVARVLSRRGWHCVLLARRRDRLEATAGETGGEVEVCDVSDRDAVERAAAAVLERHPAVHLLVNNAGIPGRAGFVSLDADRIEQLVRTNYLGGVWCLRAFLPGLVSGAPSDVVNVASVAGTVAIPQSGPYAAVKSAQLAFSRATAAELRRRGIRVHAVNPGFVHTEGFPNLHRFRHPLWRRLVIRPERVAEHVADVVGSGRVETYVPAWYRGPAILQAVAPGAMARLLAGR